MSGDMKIKEVIRKYWNENPHEYRVSEHPPGTIDYFNDIKVYYDKKHSYMNDIIDYLNLKEMRVLEIGCGLGNELVRLAQSGAVVTGVDISDFAVQMSKMNLEVHDLKAEVFRYDGECLKFQDQSFDLVLSISSLPYTPNPDRIINEIHRVLKKGREAYIVVYNADSWLNLLFKIFRKKSYRDDAPVFKQHTIDDFKAILSPFSEVIVTSDRFPYKTDRDNNIQTVLYNFMIVPAFNLIPKKFLKNYGHHIIAKAVK